MEFKVGHFVYWEHGSQPRVADVLEVTDDSVLLQGMSSKYWIKKKTLEKKVRRYLDK